jgi:CheY-like chemotaxis protein
MRAKKVLAVHDSPTIRETVRSILETSRFSVIEANSGREALRN